MLKVERDELVSAVKKLKSEGFDYLVKITGVDYSDHLEAIYILRNFETMKDGVLEVSLSASDPWVHTLIGVHPSADWYERELYEMFGISIRGRKAQRLLLEKWDGTDPPLRKSFAWNAQYRTEEDKK